MKNIRSDFKLDRSKKLYEEYTTTKTSYNQLAKKYKVSPQRVRYLIADYKEKGLHGGLDSSSTKEDREMYKDSAVLAREQGKLTIALGMFDEIIAWDTENNNLRGKMDALGHKKITLGLMADKTQKIAQKKDYLNEALLCIEESIKLGKASEDLPSGQLAIQTVHLAGLLAKSSEFVDSKEAGIRKKRALELVDQALADFPGSEAHKSWPLVIKASILYDSNEVIKALNTLMEAKMCLFNGYDSEVKHSDQASLKLRVWNSGVELGFAKIYLGEKKYILAEVYATAVLQTPDPEKVLLARKAEAKKILNDCSKQN